MIAPGKMKLKELQKKYVFIEVDLLIISQVNFIS
jgi:hypothetical protein